MSKTEPGNMPSSGKKRRIEEAKKRETLAGTAIVLIVVILLAGAVWYFVSPAFSSGAGGTSNTSNRSGPTQIKDPTLTTCISDANLAMHIHVQLSIVINGSAIRIPANIGVRSDCTRPVHTHDDTGEIHIESPVVYQFTLKDFFLVWDEPFDNTQILQYRVDSSHTVRMTVNGAVSTQFENYVFHDGDAVQITYGPYS